VGLTSWLALEGVRIQKRSVVMALTGRDMIESARQAVATIPNDQLHAQLVAGDAVVVIDVREKEEWDAGHIPQGTFLSRGRLEGRVEELVPDKNTPIVTH
jgi:predicted sulfurtransferase